MLRVKILDLDLDCDARFLDRLSGLRQSFISSLPAQKTSKQAHIRALTIMGGSQ